MWSGRDDFQSLESLWCHSDKGSNGGWNRVKFQLEVDNGDAKNGDAKTLIVRFCVRGASDTRQWRQASTPIPPPVLKLLTRDRNTFACSWTDSALHDRMEYVLQMCTLGAERWNNRRQGRKRTDTCPGQLQHSVGGRKKHEPTIIGRPSSSASTRQKRESPSSATSRRSLEYPPANRVDKSLSVANQYREVWRGKDRAAFVKEQVYAALVKVRRLLPDNDAVSARLSPIRGTMFARTTMHIAFISCVMMHIAFIS